MHRDDFFPVQIALVSDAGHVISLLTFSSQLPICFCFIVTRTITSEHQVELFALSY